MKANNCGRIIGLYFTVGWRPDVVVIGVRRMNEVNRRRVLLVLGWATVFGRVYHLRIPFQRLRFVLTIFGAI